MDKKQMEKYLKMYPEIDREIERLQGNLEYYASERERYQKAVIPEKERESMIKTIDRAYRGTASELHEAIQARRTIEMALNAATPFQRTIIEFRFWQKRRVLWADVAEQFNYHQKSIERIYGDFVKLVT